MTASVSVVVPVYNEVESVPKPYRQLADMAATTSLVWEFVLVDDGSRDGTWEALMALHQRDSRVRAIRFKRNFGQTAAMACGIGSGNTDWAGFSSTRWKLGQGLAWRDDGDSREGAEPQQVRIAADDERGVGSLRCGQHPIICRILADDGRNGPIGEELGVFHDGVKEHINAHVQRVQAPDELRTGQDFAQLLDHAGGCHERNVPLFKALQQSVRRATPQEGRHQDIGVQDDPHQRVSSRRYRWTSRTMPRSGIVRPGVRRAISESFAGGRRRFTTSVSAEENTASRSEGRNGERRTIIWPLAFTVTFVIALVPLADGARVPAASFHGDRDRLLNGARAVSAVRERAVGFQDHHQGVFEVPFGLGQGPALRVDAGDFLDIGDVPRASFHVDGGKLPDYGALSIADLDRRVKTSGLIQR